jgi:hypothetical protein
MTEAETRALLALANAPNPKAGCPLNLWIGPLLVRRGWAELGSRCPLYRITEAGRLAFSAAPIAARMTIEEYVLRRLSQGETDVTVLARDARTRFVARINSRAQSAPRSDIYVRRTYSGRPSSSMRFSEAAAMATSVVCRPSVRERSASPITRL